MTKRPRRYVAKAQDDGSWRIWNKLARKYWGQQYNRRPDEIIDELNGEKRPDILTALTRKSQIQSHRKTVTRRIGKS